MMQNQKDLQSVLDEMFAAEKSFSFESVRTWQARYPQFAREITEAVADWREFEFFALEDSDEELPELSATAEKALEKVLAQFQPQSFEEMTNLRETAEKKGLARESLPQILGVSETLMRKIERRNLKEIPNWLEKKLAEILQISTESVQKFFDLPATLSPAARYKSKNAPQTQAKQTFAEAVKNDPELTEEEKRELLKFK
jgi:DNA-binding XRE family transcriptional regulator